MRAACAELGELRSAFVDGALSAADYDRLSVQLAGCAACRRDVADLRTVHELIQRNAGPEPSPPADLSRRLAAIPGSAAATSARAPRPGVQRSGRRRGGHVKARATAFAGVLTLTALGVTGYLVAPVDLAAVGDPSVEAEVDFSSALADFPLSTNALGVLARSNPADLVLTSNAAVVTPPGAATGEVVSEATALEDLRQAAVAVDSVNFVAQQSFVAYGSNGIHTARVQVVSQSGQDSQISIVSQNGRAVASGFSPAAGSSRMTDDEVLSLLERNYDLSGVRGAVVAGRSATMLQATRDGVVAGRWWVDDHNGLILWRQRFDPRGQLQVSTGFTRLELSDRPDLVLHLPPHTVRPASNIALTLSNAGPLGAGGWACKPDLAGLSLIKLRADRADDPQAVHLVYSDGLATVSVSEQRGQVAGAPANSTWDGDVRAYVQHGAANLASWESGDRVITVMTDGPAELLARTVASLPHEPPHERTTMERVQAGLGRMLATVKG